ncbi:hypothetical protein Taro_022921 [Colocasia esculenta]|uniref:Uncharacterized protein n=1 Tax=Colocasia esculenta TaxID=4460 RepID=A0A843VFU0_COLES|nr:hypothetical protein [Colocasia esculenta]
MCNSFARLPAPGRARRDRHATCARARRLASTPMLVPETENQGVCISLACSSSGADVAASFRPKVEMNCDAAGSQSSQSPSPPVTGPVRLGTHVSFRRVDGNNFQKRDTTSGNVSDVRMSRSAIIPVEGADPLFVYGDEAFHGMCVWELASFRIVRRLKPHQHPIFDIKYSNNMSRGLLGCVSEKLLQVFRVSPEL